jgi:serine-type D-Ala-D-Ala carboxypeptidase (penicillin-binding protein 5/6)
VLDADVLTLLDSVRPGFQNIELTSAGREYGRYSSLWGDTSDVVAAEDASIVVWSDTPISLLVQARPVTLGAKGDDIGMLNFTVGTTTIEVPLELESTIDDPGPGWRLGHPGELF